MRKERKEKRDARGQLLKQLAIIHPDKSLTAAQLERRIKKVRHGTLGDLLKEYGRINVVRVVKTERIAGKDSKHYTLTNKGRYYAAAWNPELEQKIFSQCGTYYTTMKEGRKQKLLSIVKEIFDGMTTLIESGKKFPNASIELKVYADENGTLYCAGSSDPWGIDNVQKQMIGSKGRHRVVRDQQARNETHELLKTAQSVQPSILSH